MDLLSELDKLSWRKFIVLLNGLSGNSIWVALHGCDEDDGLQVISDPEEAERQVKMVWGL